MPITRILIVDDEAVSRNLLRKALNEYESLEIVGSVSNCRLALKKIPQVTPDIVVMDVDMPETDVIQTVLEIRKSYPDLPVLMLCARKENKNAARVLQALAAGANDYIPKSRKPPEESETQKEFSKEFFDKIRPFCLGPLIRKKPGLRESSTDLLPQAPEVSGNFFLENQVRQPVTQKTSEESRANRVDILAIGVSTGGPEALSAVLSQLPADFPVPIVIVQHMPPEFTDHLARSLNRKTPLFVKEAQDGDLLSPGTVFLAPGGRHMTVRPENNRLLIRTHSGPPENSCRPAVDVLFRSVAEYFGSRTLAVVLTGMGQDGFLGSQKIHRSGGTIFVQDEPSSVVWGMPGALARSGLAGKVLPLQNVAQEIINRIWLGRSHSSYMPVKFIA